MASTLKINTLTGVSTAGSIAVTGEGNSTTTNLQQGLCKHWIDHNDGATVNDSFNNTSLTDGGTIDLSVLMDDTDTQLSESEVEIIKRQHDKKEWGYKCNDTPMCNLCDKKLCRERKFGIGEEIVFPALTDLQKIKLEKPYYYLNVDGERLHLENVKFLKQQSLFQEACMEQLDFKPPTVKPKDWDMIINPLMKNHEPIDPPEGVTTQDQLQNHLEEFCLDRHIGSDVKDLKRGGVLTKDGYHHFIFDKFYNQFLIRKRWDVPYSRTAQMLKETCNCDDKRISKERISVFVVKQFDKKTDDYTQKELKPKDPY